MKKLGAFLGFLIILLTVGILIITIYHSSQYKGEIAISGLSEETTAYFYEYGIPQLYGIYNQ